MKTKEEILSEINQYCCTENYYQYPLSSIKYTDGIKFLAESAESYWLIDFISRIMTKHKIKNESFQVYHLKVNEDHTGIMIVSDGDDNILAEKEIGYTDFPLPEIKVWCIDKILLLPGEY